MRNKAKGFIAGFLTAFVFMSFGVMAKNSTEFIEAVYKDITIYLDGDLLRPVDGQGAAVEPFIHDGTTYLPLRAVASAVGKKVAWDPGTNTVYLGERPKDQQTWMDICAPYQYMGGTAYLSSRDKYFSMAGGSYSDGFVLTLESGRSSTADAYFDMHGQYQTLTFKAGQVDLEDGSTPRTATLVAQVDGQQVYQTSLNYGAEAKTITIPLNGGSRMTLSIYIDASGGPADWRKTACGFTEGKFE